MHQDLAAGYDAVIFDLDGVLYVGQGAVPQAVESVLALAGRGVEVWYATNNASRSAAAVREHLSSLGFPVAADRLLLASEIAATTARQRFLGATIVRIVGTQSLAECFRAAGFEVLTDESFAPGQTAIHDGEHMTADLVVQGHDPQTGWARLTAALRDLDRGAAWIATNDDLTIPLAEGIGMGNGAMVAAVAAAAGRAPDLVIGKPHRWMFDEFRRRCKAERVLIVGDRLDTDIAWARQVGVDSLLVRTGIDADAKPSTFIEHLPTWVANDLRGLFAPAQSW